MPMQISISNAIGGGGGAQGSGGTTPFSNLYSMQFDGIDEYFTGVTNYSDLDGQTKATFSLWVKPQLNQTGILFHIPINTSIAQGQVLCYIDTTYRVRWSIDTTTYYGNSKINVINLNQWNHILFCLDFTQAVAQDKNRVFINGVDETAVNNLSTITQFSTSTGSLLIGEEALGYQTPFLGKIDEFAIWSGTDLRNQSDVDTIYNSGVPNNLNDNGLTAPTTWYRMGEEATYTGRNWDLIDQGSGGNNGFSDILPPSALSTDVPLWNNKSFTFDGIGDYIDCGDNNNLSFGNGSTDLPFSISAWVKIGKTTAQGIVSKYGSNSSRREWIFYTTGGKLRLLFIDASNGADNFATGTTNLSINTWYHVACTYDGRGGSTAYNGMTLYINGVSESVTTSGGSYTAMTNTTQVVEIGKYQTSELLGNIDELAIFNSELSGGVAGSDVTTIYNNGIPNDISSFNPVSWWRMGDDARWDGSNWLLPDNGSGGNDGDSVSMPLASRTSDVPI